MLKRGYIRLGSWWGIPMRMHWLAPLFVVFLGRFQFVPGFWVGTLLLTLLHELGHAFFVRRFGARVLSVDLIPVGGLCHWQGEVSRVQRAVIAWGGVLAQGFVLLLAWTARELWGPWTSSFGWDLGNAWIEINLWTIMLNMMPVPPLDGSKAWALLGLLWPQRAPRSEDVPLERTIAALTGKLDEDKLSPELKRELDRLTDEVHQQAQLKPK